VNGSHDLVVGRGYLASTVFGAVCQLYATIVIIRNRKALPPLYRFLPEFVLVLVALNVVSVMNDVFQFGALLHGPAFPFSPIFFFLVNVPIVFSREHAPAAHPIPDFDLSDRESDIVPLIVEGLSNDNIASRLFISLHTVKNHVTSIFRKAGVTNRFELLKRVSAGKGS